MGTRATIKISDEGGVYYLYRGQDGFPDVVIPDIQKAMDICNRRFGHSEIGQLISIFLGENYDEKTRVQDYELTSGFHGDESHRFKVEFKDGKWALSSSN